MSIINEKGLSPLLKYPGGKKKEIKMFETYLPKKVSRYYEPFVGGGAVYFSIIADEKYINDKSSELISFYKYIKNQSSVFIEKLNLIAHYWNLLNNVAEEHSTELVNIYKRYKENQIDDNSMKNEIEHFILVSTDEFNGLLDKAINVGQNNFIKELNKSLKNKMRRMKKIEKKIEDGEEESNNSYKLLADEDILENIETAFKAALYTHFRYIYNNKDVFNISDEFYVAIYFFIREYCFSSMFRYNSAGKFNVPYGGITYSRKNIDDKVDKIKSAEVIDYLKGTELYNEDYLIFLRRFKLNRSDFVFCDPPYDTEFNTYAKNKFDISKQEELSRFLKHECEAKFLLVIKKTDLISSLYKNQEIIRGNRRLKVGEFNKNYFVSFKNRNKRDVTHLVIYNY